MVSPVVRTINSSWSKIKEGMPVIILVLTLVTGLSVSAGKATIDSIVEEELKIHEKDPFSHQSVVKLQTSQAVVLTRLSTLEMSINKMAIKVEELSDQIVELKIEQKAMSEKLDQGLKLRVSSTNT